MKNLLTFLIIGVIILIGILNIISKDIGSNNNMHDCNGACKIEEITNE